MFCYLPRGDINFTQGHESRIMFSLPLYICCNECVCVCGGGGGGGCARGFGGVKALTRCCDILIYIIDTVSFYTL